MSHPDVSQTPTTEAAPLPVRHIVSAAPIPVVILPPSQVLLPVSVPEPLATDLRALHSRIMAERAKSRFQVQDFGEWVIELLKDAVYGDGHPWPEERWVVLEYAARQLCWIAPLLGLAAVTVACTAAWVCTWRMPPADHAPSV